MATPLSLNLAEIRTLISVPDSIAVVEAAFAALSEGRAILPGVINLDIPTHQGEVHVKGAYLVGDDYYTIKIASGFYDNAALGLPASNGLMLVFRARTGEPAAILYDEGYLTDLRTGAAGAVCAKYFARPEIRQVGLVGAGAQARFQLDALRHVRAFERVVVWSRQRAHAEATVAEMQARVPAHYAVADSVEEAVAGSELVYTLTPSRQPLVQAGWLGEGQTVIAVGSDGPDKQELAVECLAKADRVIADSLSQCLHLGEIHHAITAGVLTPEHIDELGATINGRAPRREHERELIICDLTGVGVQDAAVAGWVAKRARSG